MTEQATRRCARCCEELAAERFYSTGQYCKDCQRAYDIEWRAKRKRQDELESGLEPGATRGRIYSISAPGYDKVYVGSTQLTLYHRLYKHHANRRCWQRGRGHFVSAYDVLDYPGAVIQSLEECVYVDKQHLREREAHWIGRLQCVNRYVPGRSHAESNRISRTTKVACPTCGKHVSRAHLKDHARTRACSLLALSVRA
jgi:ssDNA-binding Zn-finger/Zn-ribbon topoisomerase 1